MFVLAKIKNSIIAEYICSVLKCMAFMSSKIFIQNLYKLILSVWCLIFWSLGVNHVFGLAELQLQGLQEKLTSSSI